MAHTQHPRGFGFTAASTADDVVDGLDLSGRNSDEVRMGCAGSAA